MLDYDDYGAIEMHGLYDKKRAFTESCELLDSLWTCLSPGKDCASIVSKVLAFCQKFWGGEVEGCRKI